MNLIPMLFSILLSLSSFCMFSMKITQTPTKNSRIVQPLQPVLQPKQTISFKANKTAAGSPKNILQKTSPANRTSSSSKKAADHNINGPQDERNITIRKRRNPRNKEKECVIASPAKPCLENNANITMRNNKKTHTSATQPTTKKSHVATPVRRCVKTCKNLPAALAIAFVDHINAGDYTKAANLLRLLPGYQPAHELKKIYSADIKNSLFASKEQWKALNTRHINKQNYGRMALLLITHQAKNENLPKKYTDYFTSLISTFNTELNINLNSTN